MEYKQEYYMVQQIQNIHSIVKKINMKFIKLGTWLEILINIITFGKGERLALLFAKRFFNSDTCGCCERKWWLDHLTNPTLENECNKGIKL